MALWKNNSDLLNKRVAESVTSDPYDFIILTCFFNPNGIKTVIRSSDQSKLVFVTTVFSTYYKYNGFSIFVVAIVKMSFSIFRKRYQASIRHSTSKVVVDHDDLLTH